MIKEIKVPKLGHSMTQGFLAEWLVDDGGTVGVGTPIYRIETEKVESEMEAPVAGRITLRVEPDQDYDVGTVIASIETDDSA